jgi:ABC-type glycerol-3-phosphate transport system substrate-binding protein
LIWNQSIGKWVSASLTPIWPATPTGSQVIRQLRQWRSPFRSSATRSALGATLTGSVKWIGGVLGSDGKIYGIPYNATDILIIDPVAGTATRSALGANLTDSAKWFGGVLGSDGKIYGIPYNATDILIIDPVAGTATRSALGANLTDLDKWIGGVLGSDGKIYAIPLIATDILIINNQSKLFENNLTLSPYLNKF